VSAWPLRYITLDFRRPAQVLGGIVPLQLNRIKRTIAENRDATFI
jgi:hypothetical protein